MVEGNREVNLDLSGFLVFSEMNSEGIYIARYNLSHLTPEQIEELRHRLEELYARVDKAYTKTSIRSRSFHIKWANVWKEVDGVRVRSEVPVMKFYIVPQRVVNWIKQSRKAYYNLLRKYAVKITMVSTPMVSVVEGDEDVSKNVYEKNLYLLPQAKVNEFMEEFSKIQEAYRLIHAKVRDFAYSDFLVELNRILEDYDLEPISPRLLVEREPVARVNMMSVELNNVSIRRWMETNPEVARQLQEAMARFVAGAIRGLQSEIQPILDEIKKNIQDWVQGKKGISRWNVIERIDAVQDKMEVIGLGRIDELDAIRGLLSGDKVEIDEGELDYLDSLMEGVEGRISSFMVESKPSEEVQKAIVKQALDEIDREGLKGKKKESGKDVEIEF